MLTLDQPTRAEAQGTCQLGIGSTSSKTCLQEVTFCDGIKWLVRLPLAGHVSPDYADEKLLWKSKPCHSSARTLPFLFPEIKYWGLAAANPLGLGPYIILDFIEGVPLDSILGDPRATHNFRLIRDDIGESVIESLYRQLAKILLQLFQFDFDRIGSLLVPKTRYRAPVRPLTFKVHDMLQTGGVDTFGNRNLGFSTTSEYFRYVLEQYWEQFWSQPNSIGGEFNARTKYESLSTLQTLLDSFIHPDFDRGPFKPICDDLSLASVIVRGEDDLAIVGLVDFEWSYVGPAQLFGSAPWWLLGIRLNNVDTFSDDDQHEILTRFTKHLRLFRHVLSEE
ncbi:uncharacterized protein E0L32_005008 [Thyridium curvatum]|uniref:Aminoglycoside phosphotransferase domain-containing protein n=1 Tax=Thyridium curvatum TaxID=1093900 RepID=A0A507BBX7_9PEZI|nr:uncharacterized protein E0L32_005008 [Thyridium curvatum]TPX14899.1 hypothetical protein E0L32_005008 [Thyridium curvatum]